MLVGFEEELEVKPATFIRPAAFASLKIDFVLHPEISLARNKSAMLCLRRFSGGKTDKSGSPRLWNIPVASRNKENIRKMRKHIMDTIEINV